MIWFLFIILMGVLSRMAGNGFGARRGLAWLPEVLFALPFGIAAGWASNILGAPFVWSLIITAIGSIISFGGMQAATWTFLRWESHDNPNMERTSTLKPIIDWVSGRFGYSLGDEGYSWIAASVKGFLIGLPVGGLVLAILWPLGYEIGSHAKGRVERLGLDPHLFAEFFSGCGGGIAIFAFVSLIEIF